MMPPAAYKEARFRARFHLQVEVVDRGEDGSVRARVKRVFRGHAEITRGDEVRFAVAVCRPGELVRPGEVFTRLADFNATRYMEVFLNGTPPACCVAASQWCRLIKGALLFSSLTSRPWMRVPTEKELAAAWEKFP